MSGNVHVRFREHLRGKLPRVTRLVCAFVDAQEAQRFYEVLPKRLAKFGLEVAPEKTQQLPFQRGAKARFTFLGFEFYWGHNRFARTVLQRRTDRKKYRAALAGFTA